MLDSFAAELVTRDLAADLAENPQLDIFIATPCRITSLVEVIRRGWDLEDLRARDEAFPTRWEYLDMCETHWALRLLMLFSVDWLDLLQHDLGLPTESLDDDWPGERSAATAYRLFEVLQGPAVTHCSTCWSRRTRQDQIPSTWVESSSEVGTLSQWRPMSTLRAWGYSMASRAVVGRNGRT